LQFFAEIGPFLRDLDRRFGAIVVQAGPTLFSGEFSAPLACGLRTGK
jgi:hypothetical protein